MGTFKRIDDGTTYVNHPPQVGQTRRLTFTGETFAVLDWEENRGPRGVFTIDAPFGAPDTYSVSTLHDVSTYVSGPTAPDLEAVVSHRVALAVAKGPDGLDPCAATDALRSYAATYRDLHVCPDASRFRNVLAAVNVYVKRAALRPADADTLPRKFNFSRWYTVMLPCGNGYVIPAGSLAEEMGAPPSEPRRPTITIQIGTHRDGGRVMNGQTMHAIRGSDRFRVVSPTDDYLSGAEIQIVAVDDVPRVINVGEVLRFDSPSPGLASVATVIKVLSIIDGGSSVKPTAVDGESLYLDAPPAGTPPIYVRTGSRSEGRSREVVKTSDVAPGIASLQDLAAPLRIAGKVGTTLDRDTLAADWLRDHAGRFGGNGSLAKAAYEFADAMIAESAKGQTVEPDDSVPGGTYMADARTLSDALHEAGEQSTGPQTVVAANAIRRLLAELNGPTLVGEARMSRMFRDELMAAVKPVQIRGEFDLQTVRRIVTERMAGEASNADLLAAVSEAGALPRGYLATTAAWTIRQFISQLADARATIHAERDALRSAVGDHAIGCEPDVEAVTRILGYREHCKANQSTLDKIADTVLPVRADGETVLGCVQRIVKESRADVNESKRVREAVTVARNYVAEADDRLATSYTVNAVRDLLRSARVALATIPGTTDGDS